MALASHADETTLTGYAPLSLEHKTETHKKEEHKKVEPKKEHKDKHDKDNDKKSNCECKQSL